MWNRRHRFIRRLAAGLAFAAVVVPTAQARVVEGTGIGSSARQEVVADFKGYGYYEGTSTAASDGQLYRQSPGVPVSEQNPSVAADDRADRVTPEAGNPQVVAAPAVGFDWSDAGIGAGAAVGALLLALGAALAAGRVGRKALAGA
jgi:hypothetical protein